MESYNFLEEIPD